jgi:hypothetical protein
MMNKYCWCMRWCMLLMVLLALPGRVGAAQGVSVATITSRNQNTQLFLEFPAQSKYRVFILEAPNRIVIDLDGVAISPALQALPAQVAVNDATLAGIRIGRFKTGVTRIVLDIKTALPDYQVSHQMLSDQTQRLSLQWPDASDAGTTPTSPDVSADAGRGVTAARLLTTAQGTRLSFDLPTRNTYQVFTVAASNQIVVQIDGVPISPALQILPNKLLADDPNIAAVQVKQLDPLAVRVELAIRTVLPELQLSTQTLSEHTQRLVVQWSTPPAPPMPEPGANPVATGAAGAAGEKCVRCRVCCPRIVRRYWLRR